MVEKTIILKTAKRKEATSQSLHQLIQKIISQFIYHSTRYFHIPFQLFSHNSIKQPYEESKFLNLHP